MELVCPCAVLKCSFLQNELITTDVYLVWVYYNIIKVVFMNRFSRLVKGSINLTVYIQWRFCSLLDYMQHQHLPFLPHFDKITDLYLCCANILNMPMAMPHPCLRAEQ